MNLEIPTCSSKTSHCGIKARDSIFIESCPTSIIMWPGQWNIKGDTPRRPNQTYNLLDKKLRGRNS